MSIVKKAGNQKLRLNAGAAMAACLSITMSAAAQTPVNVNGGQVYSFGDSLSDTGNIQNDVVVAGGDVIRFFSSLFGFGDPLAETFGTDLLGNTNLRGIYFNGRFSDGKNWVDFIRDFADTEAQRTAPFLLPQPRHTSSGFNFAHGGAVISSSSSPQDFNQPIINLFTSSLTLTGQVNYFERRRWRRRGFFNWGFDPIFQTSSNDYATISIGGNDFNAFASDDFIERGGRPRINSIASQVIGAVEDIHDRGINQIFVMETPDVTLTPLVRARIDAGGLTGDNINRVVTWLDTFNDQVASRLDVFELETGAEVYHIRVNELFRQIIADVEAGRPTLGGFTNVDETCLQNGQVWFLCNDEDRGNGETYLFFDPFHPTELAYSLIAQQAVGTLEDVRIGNFSGFARSSALSELMLLSNQLISSRMNSFATGGFVQGSAFNDTSSFANNNLAFAVSGQISGLGFHQTGAPLGDDKFVSFYSYIDGQAPGYNDFTPADTPETRLTGRSLDSQEGEWSTSYGADIQFSDKMLFGAAYSRSIRTDNLFSSSRDNSVQNVAMYLARVDGPMMAGLTLQSTTINQDAIRQSRTRFIGLIDTQAESRATTLRFDAQYRLPTEKWQAGLKTKLAYSRHDHDGFRSRDARGLIDNFFPDRRFEAAVAYAGGEVSKSIRLARDVQSKFTAEAGMLATSSTDIGFAPVLDDTMAANPDFAPVGFADPLAQIGSFGMYSSVGAQLKARDRFSLSASVGALTTGRGTQQIGRLSAGFSF